MNYNGIMTPLVSVDSESSKLRASLEATYGPYNSIDAAYNAIVDEFGGDGIPIGLTVGIKNGNNITNYWFNGGTAKSNLVAKYPTGSSGSNSSGGTSSVGPSIMTVDGVLEDTNTNLNTLFPTANIGDHIIDTANEALYLMYEQGHWFKMVGAVLTDTAPVVTRIVNANILSYK